MEIRAIVSLLAAILVVCIAAESRSQDCDWAPPFCISGKPATQPAPAPPKAPPPTLPKATPPVINSTEPLKLAMQDVRSGRISVISLNRSASVEEPERTRDVRLEMFKIARRPVSAGEFKRYCRVANNECLATRQKDSGEPVLGVSWQDALNYADWLSQKIRENYCLPFRSQLLHALKDMPSLENRDLYFWARDEFDDGTLGKVLAVRRDPLNRNSEQRIVRSRTQGDDRIGFVLVSGPLCAEN